jgi:hypothetical protein
LSEKKEKIQKVIVMVKQFFFLMLLLFFSGSSFGWIISGDSVFEEDAQSRITVTPHTAYPVFGKYRQDFELCNKTASDATVYAAYIFNKALRAGKVEHFLIPQYGWDPKQFVCDYNFVFQLNLDADRNPHWAKCFQTIDVNGSDANVVFFDGEFKTGNIGTRTVNYDVNVAISGNRWLDFTGSFSNNMFEYGGRHIYPYIDGLLIQANSCKSWRIEYEPARNDATKKWELWVWAGASWDCILDDSCAKVLRLDPWWTGSTVFDELFYESCDAGRLAGWFNVDSAWDENLNTFERTMFLLNYRAISQVADFNAGDVNISMKVKPGGANTVADVLAIGFFADANDYVGPAILSNGYRLWIYPSPTAGNPGFIGFSTMIGGEQYPRLTDDSVTNIVQGVWVDVNINRKGDRWWLYVGDEYIGTVNDINYTQSSYVVFSANAQGAGVDEFVVLENMGVSSGDAGSVVDLNFVSIDGYAVSGEFPYFAYVLDGNLTIDFNVFNSDNNVMSVDINYGSTTTQGEGTVIVHDFNLSSAFCTNAQNWDDAIGQCSIDWNIFSVLDGNYFLKINLNGGDQPFFRTMTKSVHVLLYDATAPIASLSLDFNNSGFSADLNASTFLLNCTDNSSSTLFFDLNVDGVNLLSGWYAAGTKTVNFEITSGLVEAHYSCTDLSGNFANGVKVYTMNRAQFILINENTGNLFNLNDINGLIVYAPDSNASYDFKANNSTSVYFSDVNNDSLWFELKYIGDTETVFAVRHYNLGVFDLNIIRVCVPPFNPIFYNHYVVSSMEREVSIKNPYADCYIMWGNIGYVYQTNYLSQLFLINRQYDLALYTGESTITLGRIDGSVESTINVDALYYSLLDYNLSIAGAGLHISKIFENYANIRYKDVAQDSIFTNLKIYDGPDLIWSYNETVSPNDFNILFSYLGLTFTNNTLKLILTKTTASGSVETITQYFSVEGIINILSAPLAVAIAFVLVIFSLTFVAYRFAMGWFGIITCMIGVGILALAQPVWYVSFSQAILVIVIIFISLIYKSENAAVS